MPMVRSPPLIGSLVRGEAARSRAASTAFAGAHLRLSSIRSSIGTEDSIPKEMDHREIAPRMSVMNEVQLLFPSEPCKPLKTRSLDMVLLVEKDMCVE